MTNISQFLGGLAPSHLPVLAHSRTMSSIKAPQSKQNSPKRPEIALAQAHGQGSLVFSSHHQTLLRPLAPPSPSFLQLLYFLSLLGFCFLWSLTHFVLLTGAQFLLLPWRLCPDPWPALKPTAGLLGQWLRSPSSVPASLSSFLASRPCPVSYHWPPVCTVYKERPQHKRVSGVYTLQPPWKDSPNINISPKCFHFPHQFVINNNSP